MNLNLANTKDRVIQIKVSNDLQHALTAVRWLMQLNTDEEAFAIIMEVGLQNIRKQFNP